MKFYDTILNFPRITIAITLLLTIFFGWQSRNVQIDNSVAEFFPPDHYALLQDREVKREFDSREMILIGIMNDEGIFNRNSLEKVKSISEDVHNFTVVNQRDEAELKSWRNRHDGRYTDSIDRILSDGLTVRDRAAVRSLLIEVMNDENADAAFRLFLEELQLRLSPISDIVSIADVDNITASEWGLTVELLMPDVPANDDEIELLKSAVYENEMYPVGLVSEDATGTVILAELAFHYDDNPDLAMEIFRGLDRLIKEYRGQEEVIMAGVPMVNAYMSNYMVDDLTMLTPIVLLVMVIAMYLIFRFFKGVFIPLSVVLAALIWTVGMMGLTGTTITLLLTAMPVIVIAIGIADGIHIFTEYKLLWNKYGDKRQAILGTMKQLSRPIILTSITTMAGFGSLVISELRTITDFGIFTAFGIFSAMVFSLTFIPAALSLMKPPEGKKSLKNTGTVRSTRFIESITTGFMNKRRWIFAGAVVLFTVSLIIIPRMNVGSTMLGYFHESSEIYQSSEVLNDKFGGTEVLNIVIDTGRQDGLKDPETLGAIAALQDSLESNVFVGYTSSLADYIKRINLVMNDHDPGYNRIPSVTERVTELDWIEEDDELIEVEREVEISGRDQIAQYILLYEGAGGDDLDKLVDFDYSKANLIVQIRTDDTPLLQEIRDSSNSISSELFDSDIEVYYAGCAYLCIVADEMIIPGQLQSLGTAFIVVLLMLSVLFRSFKYGIFAMLPIFLTIAVAFGLLSISGVHLDSATSIIASIVLGIGVDYSVHYISRYRSLKELGLSTKEIVSGTLNTSGRAIIFNASTVAAGFLVLVLSSFWPIIHIGWLVAVSMITSALFALILLSAILGKNG